MIFGKHINVYYRKYALALLTGLLALFTVDYLQLKVPEIYQLVINGLNQGYIVENGVQVPFDMVFLLDRICMPMVGIILAIVFGRFLWRVTIFGAATKVETDLRDKMFRHAEDLSREYYQVNKVGNLMSLFTNDLDTVQECYGWGFMQFFDPIILCSLAITRMWRMDHLLTVLSLIPMGLLFASAAVVGKNMTRKWDYRQKCFSDLSDFAQESFSGIAVIKAFVKEVKELMAFEKLNRDSEDSNIAFTKTSVLMRILVTTFVESVICVILGYGGYLVYKGQFNAGQLMEFIGYFNAVVWPIMAVADLIDMTSRGKASLKRISELLDAPKNVFDRPGVQELTDPRGEIEFRDLGRVVWKEIRVSVLCGVCLAIACFAKIIVVDMLLLKSESVTYLVAFVVCATMAVTVCLAKIVGSTLPLLAKKLGFDPAVMASPIITTIVDFLSLLVYFAFATAMLGIG